MEIKLIGTENLHCKEFPNDLPLYMLCGDTAALEKRENQIGKWSGTKPPPEKNSRVNAVINEFGTGTVLDYFVREGWLGVKVLVDNPPAWSIKQNGNLKVFTFFGTELEY
jgi:hypothetical protein